MNRIVLRQIYVSTLLVIALLTIHANAKAGVTVQKISESALDELIQSGNDKLVITFMAAWCGPCIDELPALNKLFKKYEPKGLNLIGVSIDLEGPRAMQPIVNRLKVEFPVYWYGESAVQKFSIYAIPMIFFVKNGQIIERLPGRRHERNLEKMFLKFLDL
ncbi:MAG: TlpA disulfide reductase family protein [Desulfobacterales bacterium]|jgi:thiol-disulfide isomerase/thioredoxin